VLRGVFVPRHRTEFLVAQAAALVCPGAVVVDLCCGSGAVGAALADAVPGIELHAADIDGVAVECARRNVDRAQGRVYLGDLYEALPGALRGRVDVLVANVPYVPTAAIELLPREARIYEPLRTLDGGEDGLDVVRRLARSATQWLRAGGHLLVETSDRQASTAVDIMCATGLRARVAADDDLEATVVVGTSAPAIRPGRRLRPSPPAATASRSPRRRGARGL
jgi:release factor glutamine methyltransferase